MGFRQKNSATVFLALLGLGNILGVNGSWLFGAMAEREEDYRRALQPRQQFVQCSSGSKACGVLGCVAARRCCNAGAGWGCLAGNACYTANGFIDCYSTTMVMPTVSRKCYDFSQSGCTVGQACFKCGSTAAFCATEVIAGGGDTWLECATKSTVLTVTAAAETTSGSDSSSAADFVPTAPVTGGVGTSTPTMTGTGVPSPTPTSSSGLSGGAIAGIVIGGVAGIAIVAGLIFFLCVKKGDNGSNDAAVHQQYPQQQQPPMSYPPPQQPYSPPPQQQLYAPQPPYSPLPGYQGQMAHNGYGPDGHPIAPPISSPVYPPEPQKQPAVMPAELH